MKEKLKNKCKNLTKEQIFIIANITIILLIAVFYSARLVYYYRQEHPRTVAKKTFSSVVTSDFNLVFDGEGLYKNQDGTYTFKGKHLDNYVFYSGRLWRIIGVNKDGSIRLITDDVDTTLVWGLTNDYEESYINAWLNDEESSMIKSLNEPTKYLTKGTFCTDIISDKIESCDDTTTNLVGLLTYAEYEASTGEDGYLNNGRFWWTINGTEDGDAWHITPKGKMSNISHNGTTYSAYGVRPVINVNGNVTLISGMGSKDDPYVFNEVKTDTLADIGVGLYVKYNNYTWRVIENSKNATKIAMDGFIKDEDNNDVESIFSRKTNKYSATDTQIGYYLNTDFYKTLKNTDLILSGFWGTGQYNSFVKYDYTNITYSEAEAKIGLLSITDLFINDYDNYFLITGESSIIGTVLKPTNDGSLFAEKITNGSKVRPAIFLKADTAIKSGRGTLKDPFIIE